MITTNPYRINEKSLKVNFGRGDNFPVRRIRFAKTLNISMATSGLLILGNPFSVNRSERFVKTVKMIR